MEADPKRHRRTLARLLNKIEIDQETGCWNWLGATDRYGYGKLKVSGERQPSKAHRVSFRLHIGEIPLYKSAHTGEFIEKQLAHSCDNRSCVNPNHLTPATFHQNIFDRDNPESEDRTQPHTMSASINSVTLLGNLTRDVELRHTPKGTAVAEVTVATNRRVKNAQTDQWVDEATFTDVTLWGRHAENAERYLKKGSGVVVTGRLQNESWEDKATGQKRSRLKVVAEDLQFLPSAEMKASSDRARETRDQRLEREAREQGRTSQQGGARPPADDFDDEDDIPF